MQIFKNMLYDVNMKEKDFDPNTMTRATQADIDRIWFQLWGNVTVLYLVGAFEVEGSEYLDLTQRSGVMTLAD